jgi:hypothetical protein
MMRILTTITLLVAVMVFGLTVGWFARSQTLVEPTIAATPTEKTGTDAAMFSPQALQNMGVAWVPAAKKDFTIHREVLATVKEFPMSLRPVTARWGGVVLRILPADGSGGAGDSPPVAAAGRPVAPSEPLLEILRAPLPKIEKNLTREVIEIAGELLHESAGQLRFARRNLEIAKQDDERVGKFNRELTDGLPIIPRQTEINLHNELLRAQAEVERLEWRLFLHGFSQEQVLSISAGAFPALSAEVWKRALERNGLWPATGEDILAKLPEPLRALPWTFAAVGELTAQGKCDEALVAAVPRLGVRFQEAAALMLVGHTLEDVIEMAESGALAPIMLIRAPQGAPFWEIRDIPVKPGEKVEAGDVLALLADNRRMCLELEAQGSDAVLAEQALREGTELEGRPLYSEVGPVLRSFRLTGYVTDAQNAESPSKSYAVIDNEQFSPTANVHKTSLWHLRAGMRYRVLFPVHVFRSVFTFPRAALASEGAEKVVFLRSGNGFRRQPVHLLHEDRDFVAIADDGAVFAGDPVVVSGAFALSLALRAEMKGADTAHTKHGPACQH